MPQEFSPEALQQIRGVVRDVVHEVVDSRFESLQQQLHEGIAEHRRQFDVLHEALTSKVELVIEGFSGHNQRFDRLEREMHSGFAQTDRRLILISAHMPRPRRARPPKRVRRRRKS